MRRAGLRGEVAKFSGGKSRKHAGAAKAERGVQYFSGRRNMKRAWTREELAKFSGEGNRKHGRAAKAERTVRYLTAEKT